MRTTSNFVEMVLKGRKATVFSVDGSGIWFENNQFGSHGEQAVLACQDVAIEIHNTRAAALSKRNMLLNTMQQLPSIMPWLVNTR